MDAGVPHIARMLGLPPSLGKCHSARDRTPADPLGVDVNLSPSAPRRLYRTIGERPTRGALGGGLCEPAERGARTRARRSRTAARGPCQPKEETRPLDRLTTLHYRYEAQPSETDRERAVGMSSLSRSLPDPGTRQSWVGGAHPSPV